MRVRLMHPTQNETSPLRILVVEDDFMLSFMLRDVLEVEGYTVTLANSPETAQTLVEDGEPVDVLLTDVRFNSSVNGFELAKRIRAVLPDLPVLYITGDVQYTVAEMGEVVAPILQKPVPSEELVAAIVAVSR